MRAAIVLQDLLGVGLVVEDQGVRSRGPRGAVVAGELVPTVAQRLGGLEHGLGVLDLKRLLLPQYLIEDEVLIGVLLGYVDDASPHHIDRVLGRQVVSALELGLVDLVLGRALVGVLVADRHRLICLLLLVLHEYLSVGGVDVSCGDVEALRV